MEEITAFIKGAICDDQCLGRCLYIHGVPGTGKVFVLALDLYHSCSWFKLVNFYDLGAVI